MEEIKNENKLVVFDEIIHQTNKVEIEPLKEQKEEIKFDNIDQPNQEKCTKEAKVVEQPNVENEKSDFTNYNEEILVQNFKLNIKIFGIGGAGCNVVKHLNDKYPSVKNIAKLYALNTDLGSLTLTSGVENKFLLNKEELKGYGSGSDPEVGRQAIIHDAEIIKKELEGTDILFIIAGLGKGAGSGGAPEIAKIAKGLGILTVSIVNMPSIACEGNIICNNAFNALQSLLAQTDSVTTISNERIISNKHDLSFFEAYALANDEIANIITDIINIIYKPTAMNIDFSDLKIFMRKNKFFMMTRVGFDAANISDSTIKNAIISKIRSSFTDVDINKAKSVICNISMSKKTPTTFVSSINKALAEYTNNNCLCMSSGIDYNDSNQIDVCFLISGNNISNDFNEITSSADEAKWQKALAETSIDNTIDNQYKDLLKDIETSVTPTKELSKDK